jgi:hypothetical protein
MTKRAKSLPKRSKRKSKTSRARAARKPPAKHRQAGGDPLDALIDASARALDLPLDPAWRAAVKTNLDVTFRLARLFADFPLPDDAEPAPVFVA